MRCSGWGCRSRCAIRSRGSPVGRSGGARPFLRPEMSRLFLVTLVYVWVALALFWVGMPFTLRDQIAWVTGGEKRWRAAVFAGLAYGALLLVLPLTFAKPA